MILRPSANSAKVFSSLLDLVAALPRRAGLFFHFRYRPALRIERAAARSLAWVAFLAAGLVVGAAWAPIPPAAGQTALPAGEEVAAAALEAHAENGASSLLPLVSESLDVRIDDGHATARYVHVFRNESRDRLEGNYRLLVGEGATATGFAYYDGEEKIVGEIFERAAAQQVYEGLTGLHRDPGLLEQAGEGGFCFHVFPIEPAEQKRVEVTTSRWLVRRGDAIEYRVRLSRPDASVVVRVKDARGVRSLVSPSHDLRVERGDDGSWTARVLAPKSDPTELVLRYEPAEPPLTLRVAVHHDPGQGAFFGAAFSAPQAAAARTASDVTLVLDRSGSMDGPSIESARAAAKAIVARLLPADRINVIAFDDGVDALYPQPRRLTDAVRREALGYVDRIR